MHENKKRFFLSRLVYDEFCQLDRLRATRSWAKSSSKAANKAATSRRCFSGCAFSTLWCRSAVTSAPSDGTGRTSSTRPTWGSAFCSCKTFWTNTRAFSLTLCAIWPANATTAAAWPTTGTAGVWPRFWINSTRERSSRTKILDSKKPVSTYLHTPRNTCPRLNLDTEKLLAGKAFNESNW